MPRISRPVTSNNFADVMFERYHAELDLEGREVDEQFKEGIARLQDFISSNDISNSVCLICLEQIVPNAAVWTCRESCFCVLHLVCTQGWAAQQLKAAAAKAASQAANPDLSQGPASQDSRAASSTWGCPKCRAEYPGLGAPREYRCMCGKVADPGFDPWLLPHTCGSTCDRQLQPPCGHNCVLLCHPGPCPPCPRQVTAACYCRKAKAQRRCGAARWSCTRLCGKLLPCGHRCPLKCHDGDCGPCRLTGTYSCRCGSTTETRSCQERDFRCQEVCMKTLQCGQCKCMAKCHAGDCGLCAKAGSQTCPCGKVLHTDLPCDQEAPTCGATCGKLLPCGKHHCQERCHAGPCPETCRLLVDKSCACGQTQRRMPCSQPLRCERRCTVTRSCGRHQCKRRCCGGDCPPCDQLCGRKLRCGNHLCPSPCHAGPCQPCPLSATIACACGRTTFSTPCGTESSAKPPKCSEDCPVPRTCTHAKDVPPHPCHFGPCPSCTKPCGTLRDCGHACPAKCHHPKPPPVPEYTGPPPTMAPGIQLIRARKPGPPAPPPAVQVAERVKQTESCPTACPPCQQMLSMTCHGGHVTFFQHCSVSGPFTCGAACGQPLKCGNHTCAAECHQLDAEGPGEGCRQCALPCQRLRSCEHPCALACHPEACPECQEEVRLPCHCTRSTICLECIELQQAKAEGPEAARELLRCGKVCHRLLEICPHLCEATCHAGPCPSDCSAPVTVRCACRRRKERRPCSLVRQQLRQRGLPAVIDDSSAAQLLGCDSKCSQLKDEKRQKKAEHSQKQAEASAPAPMDPVLATVATPTMATSKERKRALQKERAAERERALVEKQRAGRWQAIRRKIWRCLPYVGFGLLVTFLVLILILVMFKPSPEEMDMYYELVRLREERRVELEHRRERQSLLEAAHRPYLGRLHEGAYDYCEECGQDD